jgi:hypothetical protein
MRALVLLALAAAFANAGTITWTGIAEDMQWFNHINWSPDQVPGPNDDVVIPSGVVQVTAAASCNSLTMGTSALAPANLTIFNSFTILDSNEGMVVDVNGNLIVNTGLDVILGTATIGGTLQFIDGTLGGGAWTVTNRGIANLGNANEKGFTAGAAFISQGQLSLGGVIVMNQSSTFTLQSATTSSSNLIIQNGDGSGVKFDASAADFSYSTGTLTIQAPVVFGQFSLQSGNISILNSMSFAQQLAVPAGSYVTALGSTVLNASLGFAGAGVISVACQQATIGASSVSGYFNAVGGDVIFAGISTLNVLTIDGGNAVFMAPVSSSQVNFLSGTTAGIATISTEQLLVSSKGFTLNSRVSANKTITFAASILSFGTSGGLTVESTANATVTGALLLTGPPNVPGVTNNGNIIASAALSSQNINIQGSGNTVVSNKLTVGTATFSQASVTLGSGSTFSGSNTFLAIGKVASLTGTVKAIIGDYTFQCPLSCDKVVTPNSSAPTENFLFSA